MDKRTTDQLINRATEIVCQDWHTADDRKELSQIRYFLSLKYKQTNTQGSSQEWLYNGLRASDQTERIDKWTAVTRAEAEAKNTAESKHGSFRELNAEAQGIAKLIDAIEGFIINLNVEFKALQQTQF